MAKLVWRAKLIAKLVSGIVTETEVARIEREDFAPPETLGLAPDVGERFRWCEHCGTQATSPIKLPKCNKNHRVSNDATAR